MILDKNTKVLVQGLGKDGTFQAQRSIEYGTNVVACVHPNRQGVLFEDRIPYFETVKDAVDETNANVGVIYVPAPFAMDAIIEQIDANLEIVVCITEGIPIHDMVKVKNHLKDKKTTLIGPNCPGIILPRLKIKVGIIPSNICHDGNVGVVSRSGTLTYEAISQIGEAGLGQSLCVGIGGDPIHGTSFIDVLEFFEKDKNTNSIVLIGEIGGTKEQEAAEFIRSKVSKPVVFTIAGTTAPKGKRMGHAGAVISGKMGLASEKIKALITAGAHHADDPSKIGETLKSIT
ncbi:MAG: succinate--CoA ligase subunit alpha [Chloroflexi bacterium]|jgi:succinyl-CoA synthetase alpha subunit|nr:MAG: succinate--CoA ligase subunit alpha [SAR202 cluster bacterium]KAA1298323.1 MAG: succinate--CoA ligase subunit alpha [SAR202 cluster bacterium]MAM05363.1 succinate--CoA ligase subunit alpha [Flavobacteriales bacterium]MAX12388.1 succinate--CoA ligase subunit alpha [Chloroflexota bacterium]|tara:strand:- start:5079 stop:5942 length:864 start_codon:yes stop_codon:yes gene_type:complete